MPPASDQTEVAETGRRCLSIDSTIASRATLGIASARSAIRASADAIDSTATISVAATFTSSALRPGSCANTPTVAPSIM